MPIKRSKTSNLELVYYSSLPRQQLDELYEELSSLFPHVSMSPLRYGPRAAAEVAIPAAIAIFVSLTILSGFLQEIGAGTARALRTKLGKVFSRVKEENPRWMNMAGGITPAPIISIHVPLEDTTSTVTFIFPSELSETKFLEALDSVQLILPQILAAEHSRLKRGRHDPLVRPLPYMYIYSVRSSAWSQAFPRGKGQRLKL